MNDRYEATGRIHDGLVSRGVSRRRAAWLLLGMLLWAVDVGASVADASRDAPAPVVAPQLADSVTPSGVVRQLVTEHLASQAGFDSTSVNKKRRWLTASLAASFAHYFAKPVDPDEVPDLDGDPFTDSQDYPTRFTVGAGQPSGARMLVPVRFFDGIRRYTVTYVLRRERGSWRIADIRDRQGTSLLRMLK